MGLTEQDFAGTVMALREAASFLSQAADRLEVRDAWHMEHARGLMEQGRWIVARCERQVERAQIAKTEGA